MSQNILTMTQENTYNHPKHYISVDCVIFGYQDDELKLLLYPRGFEPFKGEWSLMGGFLQSDETLDEAAKRVLFLRAGLHSIYLKEVGGYSQLERDPVSRVVSMVHYALVRIEEQDNTVLEKHGAKWWSLAELPSLILDHKKMIENTLRQLQKEANEELLGKELLPELFTILQLRNVYESIFQRELEPANFRKKILSSKVLERHNTINTTESKKGAYYYSFKSDAESIPIARIVKVI